MNKILATIISICLGSMTYGQDLKEPPNISDDSSRFASQTTELGKYQHKLYLQIGKIWNQKVQQSTAQIGEGRVVIKFHVNPSGKITNISFVEGNPDSKLGTISHEAIFQGGESCDQFSEALKKEKPGGFDWQMPFKFY